MSQASAGDVAPGGGGDPGAALWSAILITIVAAAGNNIGKALQKQATRHLPRLTLRGDVVAQYATSGTWLLGMAADLGGALLMIAAFARAPVSVVQPVSSVGLVFLMLFSHFYLKERLQPHEWVAAATAGFGVLLLGASSDPEPVGAAAPQAGAPAAANGLAARVLAAFVLLLAVLGLEVWWRQRRQQRKHRRGGGGSGHHHSSHGHPKDEAADAAACGLEAGACFGFSAAACRTGFQLAPSMGWALVPAGLAASVALTSSGFVLQTRGLKHGKAVVVCTLAAASSMVSGVAVGLLALGEGLPHGAPQRALRLAAWVLILLGVTQLSGGGDDSDGAGIVRWAEGAVRNAPLPHALRLWLLAALRGLQGLLGSGDGGGARLAARPSKSSSLLLPGHAEDGPALPVVAAAAGGGDAHLPRMGSGPQR
ncbi:MAG: hypothetical protein J3K34DRAFT_520715 [Monoraphidium minutum]|nr:MAG: hypothetical protein J3K34DRAFT_520715 [Monoraphidium minutum]